jgi:hypothetical protein
MQLPVGCLQSNWPGVQDQQVRPTRQ